MKILFDFSSLYRRDVRERFEKRSLDQGVMPAEVLGSFCNFRGGSKGATFLRSGAGRLA
jgi:hypothetical protein